MQSILNFHNNLAEKKQSILNFHYILAEKSNQILFLHQKSYLVNFMVFMIEIFSISHEKLRKYI